jgi:hypothetical protein
MLNFFHTIGLLTGSETLKKLLQYSIASILLATGIGKLLDVPGFIEVIKTYQVFPHWALPFIAISMVLIELRLSEALFRGAQLFEAALFSITLHSTFTVWSIIALLRGLEIPNYGCFGIFWARPLTWLTVFEDIIMVGASYLLAYLAHKDNQPFNSIPKNRF